MSARPDLCGGHQVTGVPTAISLTMGQAIPNECNSPGFVN
jgi:hypothetical protein